MLPVFVLQHRAAQNLFEPFARHLCVLHDSGRAGHVFVPWVHEALPVPAPGGGSSGSAIATAAAAASTQFLRH